MVGKQGPKGPACVAHRRDKAIDLPLRKLFEDGLEATIALELADGQPERCQLMLENGKAELDRPLGLLSAQPAALLGLKGRGTLAVGSYGDVVVFDPAADWTYRATESKSKAKNTPFDGWSMLGKVRYTITEGRIAYASALSEGRIAYTSA